MKRLPKFIASYTTLITTAAEAAATLPLLERFNFLQGSVTSTSIGLWDIVNHRLLNSLEQFGYHLGKIHPQLPFTLWLLAATATGLLTFAVAHYLSGKNLTIAQKTHQGRWALAPRA